MRRQYSRQQRGVSLILLLAILAMVASALLIKQLNSESSAYAAVRKNRNAEVLNRAKQALIGYVAMQAIESSEKDPGRLPCPEAPGSFGNPATEGIAAGNCILPAVPAAPTVPAVGRLPWRTLGLDKLVDSAGEPLWYVVSPGWALQFPGTPATLTINSNTTGQLTVDGINSDSVALIIAPGPPFSVPACAGVATKSQVRPASGTLDLQNYLECENATSPADSTFVTSGPSGSFNDQVVKLTAAEVLPAIEAAIAKRIEREIVPVLNAVYAPPAPPAVCPPSNWGFCGTKPVFPFAAPFANPGPGTGTSDYRGEYDATMTDSTKCPLDASRCRGLLPFFQTQDCTPASDPRCTTATDASAFLVFSKSGNDTQTGGLGTIRTQSTCSWQSDVYVCTGEYLLLPISLTFKLRVTNVAMGLRALALSKVTCSAVDDVGNGLPTQSVACSVTVALQTDGSAILTVATNALPDIVASGWGTYANYKISIDRAAIGDHALLSSTDSTTGWFVRNEWYRLTYYAVAAGHTAGTLPPACITGTNCLSVVNVTPTDAQHAILILAGRSINGSSRPHPDPANYLEAGNATGAFMRNTVSASPAIPVAQRFNDRIVVIGSNP